MAARITRSRSARNGSLFFFVLATFGAACAAGQQRPGTLEVYGSGELPERIEVSPPEYVPMLFPQGGALLDRLNVNWRLPGVAESKRLIFVVLRACSTMPQDLNSAQTATCLDSKGPKFPALLYGHEAILVGRLFYGQNEAALRQRFVSLGVAIRGPNDAVDFAEFYASVTSYRFANPSEFVMGSFQPGPHRKFIRETGDFQWERQEPFRQPLVGKSLDGYRVNMFALEPGFPQRVTNWRFEITSRGLTKVCDRLDFEFATESCVDGNDTPIHFTGAGIWDGMITRYAPQQFHFANWDWIASEGPSVWRTNATLDSAERAKREVGFYLGPSTQVIESGIWTDKNGHVRGQRTLALRLDARTGWATGAEILLTDGTNFYAIESESLKNALEFEKQFRN